MSTGVLLGAGASVEAGIPASKKLTQRLVERVSETDAYSDPSTSALLNYVCGRLISHESAFGSSPYASIDVERLLAAVRLLAQRNDLEVSPFVASWDQPVAALTRKRNPTSIGKAISEGLAHSSGASAIDAAFDERVQARFGAGDPTVYLDLMEVLLTALPSLLQPSSPLDYLSPLTDLGNSGQLEVLLTLNYDTCVEQLFTRRGVPLDTGFQSWLETGVVKFGNGLPLIKLHGSVDWVVPHDEEPTPGEMPRFSRRRRMSNRRQHDVPLVIFGAREKLRADGPFLEMLHQARRRLAKSSRLVVVGYSFRDDHVNELIREWLAADGVRSLSIIDPAIQPGNYVRNDIPFVEELRLNLLDSWPPHRERRFADRIQFHPEPASVGLRSIG